MLNVSGMVTKSVLELIKVRVRAGRLTNTSLNVRWCGLVQSGAPDDEADDSARSNGFSDEEDDDSDDDDDERYAYSPAFRQAKGSDLGDDEEDTLSSGRPPKSEL